MWLNSVAILTMSKMYDDIVESCGQHDVQVFFQFQMAANIGSPIVVTLKGEIYIDCVEYILPTNFDNSLGYLQLIRDEIVAIEQKAGTTELAIFVRESLEEFCNFIADGKFASYPY